MNDIETLKLGMYESVLSFLAENRDITSGIRAFSWNISRLRKIIDDIRQKEKDASSKTLEKTIQSSSCREELIFKLVPVANSLYAFAKDRGDLALREKTRFSQSLLVRMKDKELIDKATAVVLISENKLPQLGQFGITDQLLDELKNKIEAYKYSLENKISSFISGSSPSSFEGLFMEADKILAKNIDNFVEMLGDANQEFYDDYLIARSLDSQDQKKLLMEIEEEE